MKSVYLLNSWKPCNKKCSVDIHPGNIGVSKEPKFKGPWLRYLRYEVYKSCAVTVIL